MDDPTPFADMASRVRAILEIPLHRFLGLQLTDVDDPAGGVVLDVTGPSLNQAHLLHGGIVMALLDVASYLALAPSLAAGEHAVTHDMSVQLLRPVQAGVRLRLRGEVLRSGRKVAFLRADARVDGIVVAAAQVTKTLMRGADQEDQPTFRG